MLTVNKFERDPQPAIDHYTQILTWGKAMTEKVTIFGKNS